MHEGDRLKLIVQKKSISDTKKVKSTVNMVARIHTHLRAQVATHVYNALRVRRLTFLFKCTVCFFGLLFFVVVFFFFSPAFCPLRSKRTLAPSPSFFCQSNRGYSGLCCGTSFQSLDSYLLAIAPSLPLSWRASAEIVVSRRVHLDASKTATHLHTFDS